MASMPPQELPNRCRSVQAERGAHLRQLLDEPVDCPQRDVVRAVGVPAAELVVEDDLPPVGQRFQWLQVVMREARPAMQAQQRRAALADRPVPDPAAGNARCNPRPASSCLLSRQAARPG